MKRIIISNVVCSDSASRFSSIICGIPLHDIEDVTISHVHVLHQGGGTKEQAALEPAEREHAYPEPDMFGDMPAHGFYIRHARGIRFDNVEIAAAKADQRPAFVLNDVRGADFFRIRTPQGASPFTFALQHVADLSIYKCRSVPDTEVPMVEHTML